mmetsp:Transcript_50500/g.116565  ORF Transcript_50500/g.116565 Transcript_50500/m.116565 type:complete len:128 (-) Transcript_50500:246-629(-)|eukprot:CAMPEP_0119392624 /NCGR_PEP_ID=MMETSP1334-20130426/121902_1 /TAXON_ID=127549 /ORGANISM="Calcidiscus leptoporus, Strain RCC1130" /LENGTH=127 /DNA_ID=CAMNT_0007415507 /DNA_START=27 /DNA_END=410 /DNA_ORIENTATION=+
MEDVKLDGSDFRGAALGRLRLIDSWMLSANLQGAVLDGNKLDVRLNDADLSGASLREADLTGASLQRAIATNADFSKSLLRGADFSDANLFRAKFMDAVTGLFDGVDTSFRGANCTHALFTADQPLC